MQYIKMNIHDFTVLRWKLANGDNTMRLNYPLTRDSVVLDLGGYEGGWAAPIFEKYHCNIYIFEPVTEYAAAIRTRFQHEKKIHVFPYGLAARTETIQFHLADNATSAFGQSGQAVKGKLVNITAVLKKEKIKTV